MANQYDNWIGKTRTTKAFLDPWPAYSLAAVYDLPIRSFADKLPGLWHWLYFLEQAPRHQIGADGHPKKGGFLPPIENPRRMFAGARTEYFRHLIIGQDAELVETVSDIQYKSSSQGDLVIVTVHYNYYQDDILCISEERDFIYLPAVEKGKSVTALNTELTAIDDSEWSVDLPTDPTLLFRFSALTFNSHRIHYDLAYAQQEEGYPALVVHGPLSAILLSECIRMHSDRMIKTFSFRAQNPLFCGQTVRVRAVAKGDNVSVVAYTPEGKPAVKASVVLA